MNHKLVCPSCAQKLSVPLGTAECSCPRCSAVIDITDLPAPELAPPSAAPAPSVLRRAVAPSAPSSYGVVPSPSSSLGAGRPVAPLAMPILCGVIGRVYVVTFGVVIVALGLGFVSVALNAVQLGFSGLVVWVAVAVLVVLSLTVYAIPLFLYHILRVLIATHNRR